MVSDIDPLYLQYFNLLKIGCRSEGDLLNE